jgi:SMC interacting uncharacterized protein involved in chromosome segregation
MNLTPEAMIATLSQISKDIEEKTREIIELDRKAVEARAKYRVESARVFLNSEGSMELRKRLAEVETYSSMLASELADQELRAAGHAIKALRDRLDIGRSLNALARMEWGAS